MIILLTKKEKRLFDILINDLDTLDALHILSEYTLKTSVIDISAEKEEEDDGEDGEDDEIEILKIPDKQKLKPNNTIIKPSPAPGYDQESVIETRMYV